MNTGIYYLTKVILCLIRIIISPNRTYFKKWYAVEEFFLNVGKSGIDKGEGGAIRPQTVGDHVNNSEKENLNIFINFGVYRKIKTKIVIKINKKQKTVKINTFFLTSHK